MIKKMQLLIANKFIYGWIFKSGSFNMFLIMFFIFSSSMILKNKIVSTILLLLFFIILGLRIYFRRKNLNNLDYYKINTKVQQEDMLMRSYQLSDFVAIIIYSVYIISFYSSSKNTYYNILLILIEIVLYFLFAGYSISKSNVIWKIGAIFLSTIQGFIVMLLILCLVLSFVLDKIAVIMPQIKPLMLNRTLMEELYTIFDYKNIITLCYLIKEYNNSIMLITIISTVISIMLYIIFIKNTPVYQLEKISFAFKIVNIIIVLIGIAIYFYGDGVYVDIQKCINEIKNNPQIIHLYFGDDLPNGFQTFIENYSKSEITNLGYIYFLPYTVSILIANCVIELVKSQSTKKLELALDEIIEIYESNRDEDIERYEKRFCYYGGNKHKIKLIRKMYKVNI
ncbi:hypothetical protein [Clostridium beijerinckii]|uniref:Uncharacterized protein n=1 Tax=Clostridium beijerinckii TaxID=1520 RepID=A0A1S9N9D0_CLOBE|nr:hypothetical protein [Clostridium beijerinckii]OOP74157.1 hypothetical protein CBEIBR21_06570 [Clostridium beijerinckii]